MAEVIEVNKDKEEEVLKKLDSFAELPDAPPKRKFRLSWVGWVATGVVTFWLIICLIGPYIAPFHEMDIEGDDSFLDAYTSEEGYGTFFLGTDYLGRDTYSRVLFGARNTIGISLAATLLAYLMGITLGILAAVKGGWIDMAISRVNDAILALLDHWLTTPFDGGRHARRVAKIDSETRPTARSTDAERADRAAAPREPEALSA